MGSGGSKDSEIKVKTEKRQINLNEEHHLQLHCALEEDESCKGFKL
jgi:hypothetical protein